jgi:hypothetical protein
MTTLTITIHPEQLRSIRENLNLPDHVSDDRCVELFITENTCVDENGDGF